MQTITIEIENPKDAEMILHLAERLNLRVLESGNTLGQMPNSRNALVHLRRLAEMGGLKNIIPDPVEWQKEIRRDRPLSGRE
ncbi:MAG TPA: hypothetical protein PL048_05210 [Leptospiraceae bacterium]|nr:hypothetical protein [Leptospiraceae bacterium]HMY68192.1 hypothetical protein [Leptospiraceae bacterium]HMZ58149.1 hypothetical protein [Leptospiraceae bacterium]HNF16984.1 hypothetical protein [Leptospiraceae bacterium]HNF27658.1 hypothetical protein [Leptospiraceae bacterium]